MAKIAASEQADSTVDLPELAMATQERFRGARRRRGDTD
jgi:hypothetical protein